MSRFFATGDTDTESSYESSDEDVKPSTTRTTVRRQFVLSDDDDDEKRVVRSQKDKRYDELKDILKSLRNSEKIKDIAKVQTVFETLQKAYSKAKNVVEQQGGPPKFYIIALVELEDFVQKFWEDKEAKQKLSKINAKALATLKQKVKKYNKDIEDCILHCRANPDLYQEDEEDGAEEYDDVKEQELDNQSEESEKEVVKSKSIVVPKIKDDNVEDSDDDSIDWDMTDTSDASSESEGETKDRVAGEYPYTAEYFLKKKSTAGESVGRVRKIREKKEKKQDDILEDDDEDDKMWQTVNRQKTGGQLTDKDKMLMLFGKEKVELDVKMVALKRNELNLSRGKKKTNKIEQIDLLKYLLDITNEANLGPVTLGITLRVYLDILEGCFDVPTAAAAMKDEVWIICLDYLEKVLDILTSNPDVILDELIPDDKDKYTDPDSPPQLHGNILSCIEKMDDEYTKILQASDAHSPEYLDKLKNERKVTELIERAQVYIENRDGRNKNSHLCRIYMRRIEHLYYKVDRESYGNEAKTTPSTGDNSQVSSELISKYARFIYSCHGVDLGPTKTRVVLCHIYHHAIHDQWFQARDLMLMTHLQEGIGVADINTQILYNRTIVQLGMCAFRHGKIKDAHDVLMDMHSPPRPKDAKELAKELLAQGLNPRQERTPDQEKQERRRQMPFHMHINLELMECVYLTSAMLLEIPYVASTSPEGRRRMISKGFYHQMKNHEKQPLVGPPETMREHIVAAANAMKIGDWKKCRDYILDIKIWNLFINVEQVKQMLSLKVQEETLRTYVFTYGEIYDTLSLLKLAKMFELPLSSVHSIVSKMIIKEELLASLDEPTESIVLHHAKPTTLQSLSFNLAEKIGSVADHNEELLKVKQGPGGTWMVGSSQATGLTSMSSKAGGWGGSRRRTQQVA